MRAPTPTQLAQLTALTNNDPATAQERQEDLVHLGIALLAALTFVPLGVSQLAQDSKVSISNRLAQRLLEPAQSSFTEAWLGYLRHPTSSVNVLKSLYSLCMASPFMCLHISRNLTHLTSLFDIITDKCQSLPVVVNEIVEMGIHTMSTIIIQLLDMPIDASSASLT